MTALPIVARELRVAARRPISFWGRLMAASGCVLMAITALFVAGVGGGPPSGIALFQGLATFGFIICAAAGPLLAADVLSGERRQGTLGLLFLTDLRPLDVVLGKLAAVSINAASAVLASLPVLAVSLLMGGITLPQLVTLAVVLLNMLFISLVSTVTVSAFCTESRSSLALSALLVGLVTLVLPNLALGPNSGGLFTLVWHWVRLLSPAYTLGLFLAGPGGGTILSNPAFVRSLLAVQLLGWTALGVSAFVIKRAWGEQLALSLPLQIWQRAMGWVFGRAEDRRRFRLALLDRNPWTWLGSRNLLKNRLLWYTLVPILPLWLLLGWWRERPWDAGLTLTLAYFLQLLTKLLIASEASHLFAENRRSGAFELLLTTPIEVRQITHGHLMTMRRLFAPPALVTAVAANLGVLGQLNGFERGMLAVSTLLLLWDMHALAWVGMWRGLRQKRPHLASLSAMLRVLGWPSVALFVLGVMATAAGPYAPLIMAVTVFAASNTLQTSVAVDLLETQLRRLVAEQFQSDRAEAG